MFGRAGKMCNIGQIEEIEAKKEANQIVLPRDNVQSSTEEHVLRLLQCKPRVLFYSSILYMHWCQYNPFFRLLQALAGFTKDNRIPQPLSVFDNEQVRFDHRFAPFYGLTTPPPVPYIQFNDYRAYTLKNASQNLYTDASSYFHRARTILEVIPNPDSEVRLLFSY